MEPFPSRAKYETAWIGVHRVRIYDKYSVGPSVRPICTSCCFKMTYMMQACCNLITNTGPDRVEVFARVWIDCLEAVSVVC